MEKNRQVEIVKQCLSLYAVYLVEIQNLEDEIERIKLLIEPAAPISKYGDEPPGGSGELNTVERAANKMIEGKEKIERIQTEITIARNRIKQLDRALEALKDEEREIIECFYFKNMDWLEIGEKLNISDAWARKKRNIACKKLAVMLLGWYKR